MAESLGQSPRIRSDSFGQSPQTPAPGIAQPISAGTVAALVGFGGTFALVIAGLRAVGATPDEASSGLLTLCVTMGVVAIWIGLRYRLPISIAWSTPGAALLIASGVPDGGWAAAVGAFALTGVLIVLTGLWTQLGRWIAAIPGPIASAMLAGVLLPVCLSPARALVAHPGLTAPAIVAWLLVGVIARRWAVVAALAATTVAIIATQPVHLGGHTLPSLVWTTPSLTAGAVVGLAIPLFLVTMASQNVTGIAVLRTFGYETPVRPALLSTGAATALGAPFGGHAINLAAITAALCAGPDAHPDPERRWIASVSMGAAYLGLAVLSGLAAAFLTSAPPIVIEAVAGLALLGPLGAGLAAATREEEHREAALVTLVVSASGISALSITAPFWGLVAGLTVLAVQRIGRRFAG